MSKNRAKADYTELGDDELLDMILSEDEHSSIAAEALYKRYERPLLDFYLSRTGGRIEDAEDLWHDMWTIIFRKPQYIRAAMTVPTLKALIMRIAANQVADFLRHKSVSAETYRLSEDLHQTKDSNDRSEDNVVQVAAVQAGSATDRRDLISIISRSVSGVSRKKRKVLWLKLAGFTYDEISIRTGWSAKTVRNFYSMLLKLVDKGLIDNGVSTAGKHKAEK